jgi:hypothetical protein
LGIRNCNTSKPPHKEPCISEITKLAEARDL